MKRFFSLFLVVIAAIHLSGQRPTYAQQLDSEEESAERVSPLQKFQDRWDDWPPSDDLKITLEYRNYTYLESESRGDSRDSINEGRLEIEYDRDIGDNMRLFIDALLQDDDDNFTHGFVDDFEDDDLKRNNFNFTEDFLDIYFTDFDLRLGKQIITWGKADVSNPTDNINPTDYSNLVDDETIGVVAANLNYYWNDWNLQVVGVPGFTPTRLPPQGTRFSFIPPDGMAQIGPFSVPIMDPELPSNSILGKLLRWHKQLSGGGAAVGSAEDRAGLPQISRHRGRLRHYVRRMGLSRRGRASCFRLRQRGRAPAIRHRIGLHEEQRAV